jgi:tetratricopeptide (TPR) repeat protein
MRARAHWELRQHDAAFRSLDAGQKAFPGQPEFSRIKLFYLIDLGLFQEVSRVGSTYLSRKNATADDYAAVGEGLRRSKQLTKARDVLEAAQLRFPDDEKIRVLLAHTYLDAGRPLIAAMLFEEAARREPKYALEAAELYLKAGRLERALFNNARVLDPVAKAKQRLGILLKQESFHLVAGMAPHLSRLGLLADQNVRYALAYAHFKAGEFEEAERHLKPVTEPRLFESAMQLRKAMATCREAGWECL